MRISCACPAELASETLVEDLKILGIEPIITSQVIRAVYEGPNRSLGDAILDLYARERDHEITVQYDKEEQRKLERRFQRKQKRAEKNAKLHGH